MVVLLLVKRNKEREVGPVPILLITHVITNSVKSNEKMSCNSITSRIFFYGIDKINFIALRWNLVMYAMLQLRQALI